MKKIFTFLMMVVACVAVMQAATEVTVTKTSAEIVQENDYTISAGSTVECYTSLKLDNYITVSTTGSANCGSFWGSTNTDWRLYQNKSGNIVITAAEGATLKSVKLTYSTSNNGTLATFKSGTATTVSGSEVSCSVTNTGNKTNGQVRITEFSVTYEVSGETPDPVDEVATPVITAEGPDGTNKAGEFIDEATVTITCATEGATVYYSIDSEATTESEVYTGAFDVTETCTVYALAVNGTATASASLEVKVGEADSDDPTPSGESIKIAWGTGTAESNISEIYSDGVIYSEGGVYVASASDLSNVFTTKSDKGPGLRLGTSKATGSITINLAEAAQINAAQVEIVYHAYNAGDKGNLTFNGTEVDAMTSTTTGQTKTLYLDGSKLTSFTLATSAKRAIIESVKLIAGAAPAIAVPVITTDDESKIGAQTITITCATEGATIHYTLDGNDPTTGSAVYSAALTVSESCTVKAIAVKGTDKSNVISKVITINAATSVEEAYNLGITADKDKEFTIQFNDAKVVFVNGNNIYVREGDNAILLYNTGLTLAQDAIVNGYATFKFSPYKNLPEFVKATTGTTTDANLTVTESSEEAQPVSATVQDIADGKYMNNLVSLSKVLVVKDDSGKYWATSDGETQVFQIYDSFKVGFGDLEAESSASARRKVEAVGDEYGFNLTGIVSVYQTTAQLQPTSSTAIVTGVEDVTVAKDVKSVKYYNLLGVESAEPFAGVNVVVTEFEDGSKTAAKVVK